jgi:hypothetical protein
MGHIKSLSEREVVKIRQLRATGVPTRQLAEDFRVDVSIVYQVCTGITYKNYGGPITKSSRRSRSPTKLDDKDLEQIKFMRQNGASQQLIAEVIGVDRNCVRRYLTGEVTPNKDTVDYEQLD